MAEAGTLLRAARKSRGLSQGQLAQRSGVDQSRVSRSEGAREDPRFGTVDRLFAGTGHRLCGTVTPWTGDETAGMASLTPAGGGDDGDLLPYDRATYPVLHELWRRLDAWVVTGAPMPPSTHIARDPNAADGLARDAHGNAVGGVRTPWVDAPDAHYLARSPGNPLRAVDVTVQARDAPAPRHEQLRRRRPNPAGGPGDGDAPGHVLAAS